MDIGKGYSIVHNLHALMSGVMRESRISRRPEADLAINDFDYRARDDRPEFLR